MKLTDKALLVQLSISQWSARKYDRKVTKEILTQHGALMGAGRFNKSLLPMNDYLDRVHKKASYIRTKYYTNTLPWGIEGTQMLPSANYLEFMTEFRNEKAEWQLLVKDFLDNYDRLKEDAKRLLPNGLYNENDYPADSSIHEKFNMEVAVFPVPSDDFRVAIDDDELASIQQDVERRVTEASAAAMADIWQRLYDRVKHMSDKLADPKAIFRDTMVENTRELCALLPRLNFAEDSHLEGLRQQVEDSLLLHPDALRNNPVLRQDTAQVAKDIMNKMDSFMG
jgi:hypothetical protein